MISQLTLRRFIQTIGLVLLWRPLYPTIRDILRTIADYYSSRASWVDLTFLYSESLAVILLVYFTFWFWIYVDGFLREWEIARLQYLEVIACLIRWVRDSILYIIQPPALALFMYALIRKFNTVPHYVATTTALIYLAIWLILAWLYPSKTINEVISWRRSEYYQ